MTDKRPHRQGGPQGDEVRTAARRLRTLARLIGTEPGYGEEAQRILVARLARALRGERRRGRAGHWTYDINRHIALMQAYRAERARVKPRRRGRLSPPSNGAESARPGTAKRE